MFFYILIHFSVPAIFLRSTLNQRLTGISNFRKSNSSSSHDTWHVVNTGNFEHLQEYIIPALLLATLLRDIIFEENTLKCLGNKMQNKSNF